MVRANDASSISGQGSVSRKSRERFGPEKLAVKLQSACFEKLIFLHVFNIRNTKRIAQFEGLEPRRCEDIKAVVAPGIGPKSFGTFDKQATGLSVITNKYAVCNVLLIVNEKGLNPSVKYMDGV